MMILPAECCAGHNLHCPKKVCHEKKLHSLLFYLGQTKKHKQK